MLEVEMDVFSGMPNPRWLLTSAQEAELVARVTAAPEQTSPVSTPEEEFGLGYRGMIVRMVKPDESSPWSRAQGGEGGSLPDEFRVGSRTATHESVAQWLLETSESVEPAGLLTDEVREVAARGVVLQPGSGTIDPATFRLPGSEDFDTNGAGTPSVEGQGAHSPTDEQSAEEDITAPGAIPLAARWWACGSNYFSANANTFNQSQHVGQNNCYCFASNHLAGVRYALPGRRGGSPATSITCGGVINGLYADGWRDGCMQDSLTIALVIWPNYDYHFYRLVTGGPYWWWGHKPGGTPAKYTDDCGHSIYQYNGQGYAPNNCCRGSYVDFCGYFYQNNWTAFVA